MTRSTRRTERLVLERLTVEEARAILEGDRDGRRWAADYPTDGDTVVAAVVLEAGEHYDPESPLGPYQVRLVATGEAVGGVGFLSGPEHDGIEVGYGIVESARGAGLASEALRDMLELAREAGLRRMVAVTDADNAASQRVLDRCGFVHVGDEPGTDPPQLRWERALEP